MKSSIYVETSIVSYLTARPSRDLVRAAHQELTREWWSTRGAALPQKAVVDAFHIAFAATHGVDYLLTWNCTHIANATMRPKIETICRINGFEPPVICTPLELVEE